MITLLFLILAAICFLLGAANVSSSVNLVSLGLLFVTLALLFNTNLPRLF